MEASPPDEPDIDEPTFFRFENTYWGERKRANVLLVHYTDMQTNLAAEMRRVSEFLEIDTSEALLPELVEAAGFAFMRAHGDALFPNLKTRFARSIL